jgi:hypothetical protein
MTLTCYHGTTVENWEKIKRDGKFLTSRNGWFGTGVYWYLDSYEMAEAWCRKRFGARECVVLKLMVKAEAEAILDLRNPNKEGSKLFHQERRKMISLIKARQMGAPFVLKNLDSVVVNSLKQLYDSHLVIANSFTYFDMFYDKARFPSRVANGIEVCIFNNYEFPVSEVKEIWLKEKVLKIWKI